jgi:hypothetical protein
MTNKKDRISINTFKQINRNYQGTVTSDYQVKETRRGWVIRGWSRLPNSLTNWVYFYPFTAKYPKGLPLTQRNVFGFIIDQIVEEVLDELTFSPKLCVGKTLKAGYVVSLDFSF